VNKIDKVTLGQAVGLLAIISSTAAAQEGPAGGTLMTLGVSQRLSYSDNNNFAATSADAFIATTGLNFSLMSTTKVDTIALNIDSGVAYNTDTNDVTLADPSVSLAYRQESKDAVFSATLGYQETDVSSATDIVAGSDSFVIIDEGTRVDLGGTASLDFGLTNPISGNVSLTHNRTWYRDTTSADLVDQETTGLSGSLNFRVDERITTSLTGNVTQRSTENGEDTTNASIGVGAALAYSKRLDLTTNVRYTQVEQTSGGITAKTDGVGFSFGADYEMPDGAITASLSSSVDENGRIYSGNVGRQMALKGGQLGFSLGGTGRDGGNFSPLYAINYTQELPRDASANFQLSQSFATNDSGRDAINTSLSAEYSKPLTAVSTLGASLQYRGTAVTNFSGEDVSKLDLGVNYTHALAQDWGLVTGYTYSLATAEGSADRQSNTIFVGLQKDFSWRP